MEFRRILMIYNFMFRLYILTLARALSHVILPTKKLTCIGMNVLHNSGLSFFNIIELIYGMNLLLTRLGNSYSSTLRKGCNLILFHFLRHQKLISSLSLTYTLRTERARTEAPPHPTLYEAHPSSSWHTS